MQKRHAGRVLVFTLRCSSKLKNIFFHFLFFLNKPWIINNNLSPKCII